MHHPQLSNSKPDARKPSAKRGRKLTPDERKEIAGLCARGFTPADVVAKLQSSIPTLKTHQVRDLVQRNPALIDAAKSELTVAKAYDEVKTAALRDAVPDAIEAARTALAHNLRDLVVNEVRALAEDQGLLDRIAGTVETATDASAYQRARLLRVQREHATFGVVPARPPEPAGTQAYLHLHLLSQWVPRRVAPGTATEGEPCAPPFDNDNCAPVTHPE